MKIYFDTCTLQRPLDDHTQVRIALEAEAVLTLLALCTHGKAHLIASDVVIYETSNNPHPKRRTFVREIIMQAAEIIPFTEEITQRAREFEQSGIKGVDTLQLASAEIYGVEYFCTCDDRFYRRAVALRRSVIKVRTPLALAQEILP